MPTISVVMPAYNAAQWIDETVESVLSQTRPADEVIVVNDGSTDDTAARARAHGDRVTVIEQANGGPPAAYNRGFDAATADFCAMCPADDLWDERKLEWQAATLAAHPEVDVLFSAARYFGRSEYPYPRPSREGVLDSKTFLREIYVADVIAAPTTVVRRALHRELGRFDESLPSEDYEFWLRAVRAGATFYFDSREAVRLRLHGGNVSHNALPIWEMNHRLHAAYAADVGDPNLVARTLDHDLRQIARCRFGVGHPSGARAAYAAALRQRPTAEAAIGAAVLSVGPVGRVLSLINARRPRR